MGLLVTAGVALADTPFPETQIEIFRLAPGQQEDFIRGIALWDQVSAAGGQPPTQLYVHEDGADWDVALLKVFPTTPITPAQQEAMDRKAQEMHLPTGPAFFLAVRQLMAWHTETRTQGPITAEQWLARLDAVRARLAAECGEKPNAKASPCKTP